ncbi:iron reductase domain protein [Aaosphaeria arxii CBS 175.79]|uniref:Iron reductase domain protein n=1 Tax=Aaosphaeria arxii CBS 175.79 TaxID=1450172 RepID=A0A6A5Y7C4_9PLEO|nr:iron reductase domain protein [Aaosphaeria arxii CBS 175.79]KAF2020454.1 iron reductase domain protein [Aaosphaeria arxii CBS 175.79]
MRTSSRDLLATGLLALASGASAQVASACQGDVCFRLNIPERTASSGNGDIFFQISAPSSYEWAALGQGTTMGNSNMFLIYTSADGNNVTLSPRTTSGHNMPSFNGDAQVTLLEGSGVSNGQMIANVRCSNCNSWSGGEVDFTGQSGRFIFAAQSSGGPKNSDDTGARIGQHDARDSFTWSFANAKGGSQVNPLLNTQPSGTGGSTPNPTSCIPRGAVSGSAKSTAGASPTATGGNSGGTTRGPWGRPTAWQSEWGPSPTASPTGQWGPPYGERDLDKRQEINYCDDSGNSITPIGGGLSGRPTDRTKMLIAHGVLASLAFVIFFPAGAIAIRLSSFPGAIWFHAVFQVFAYVVYIVAFGLGVYLAKEFNLPLLGFLHHTLFKKYQSRTFWSYGHIWLGRLVITLGIINGGLGLMLADSMNMSSRSGMIAYGVVAGVVWLIWVAASFLGERRKAGQSNGPPKYTESTAVRLESRQRSDVPHPEEGHYAPGK